MMDLRVTIMAKNDSAISMDDILKDRACPDCNLMMTKGFISARNMRGGIIWDSTSPDMYEGYYVGTKRSRNTSTRKQFIKRKKFRNGQILIN